MANLTLDGLNEAFDLYNKTQTAKTNSLVAQSLMQGSPVDEMPGSPLRQFIAKTGIISPNIKASPTDFIAEQAALGKQGEERMKQITSLVNARRMLGPTPFEAGGPFSGQASRLGLADALAGPTPGEINEQNKLKQQEITNQRLSPEGQAASATARKTAELNVENSPENMARKLGLAGAEERQRAAVREETAGPIAAAAAKAKLDVETSPTGLAFEKFKANAAADATYARAHATAMAKSDAADNTPLPTLANDAKNGGIYVNKDTLKVATGAKGEPSTKKQADNDGNYSFVPAKNVRGTGGWYDTQEKLKQLDKLDALVDSTDIFPDTSGMNGVAAAKALASQGIYNRTRRHNNKEVSDFYAALAIQANFIKQQQGRFNKTEFQIPLMPDPGGLAAIIGENRGLFHLGTSFVADSKQVAHEKISRMKEAYIHPFGLNGPSAATTDDELPDPSAVEPSGEHN